LEGRNISTTKEQITESGIQDANMRLVPKGSLLLSFKLSIGKVSIAQVPLYTNEAIAALPIKNPERLLPEYLYWCLKAIDLTTGQDRAAMGLTLNKAKLAQVSMPLPPIADQRRIAVILDQADALRVKRREALAQLNNLTQSIFIEMFGDVEGNGWPISSVADIADAGKGSIRTGPFGSQLLHSEFVDDGVVVLGIDNAVRNEFRWGERRFISPEKYQELKRYTVLPGDVLITIMGTCGRCAVVPADIPVAINTKHICCITLDAEKCLPSFLHSYFLMHPMARKYLVQTAKGAIMDGLNMGIIKAMPVPLVPMNLQHEFEARLKALQKTKSANSGAATELDTLFTSLQHRAFQGEL
jgi:type I restriction enzyme, S subunit